MAGNGHPVWKVAVAALLCLGASSLAAAPLERQADGILLPVGGGLLKVAVCAENVVRVAYARDRAFFSRTSLATAFGAVASASRATRHSRATWR